MIDSRVCQDVIFTTNSKTVDQDSSKTKTACRAVSMHLDGCIHRWHGVLPPPPNGCMITI